MNFSISLSVVFFYVFVQRETSPLPVKGIHIRHSWPLSSEGSFKCHTYYDIGQPFIMAISEDP